MWFGDTLSRNQGFLILWMGRRDCLGQGENQSDAGDAVL